MAMLKKVCPWCFPKDGEKDSDSDDDSDKEEEKGLMANQQAETEANPAQEGEASAPSPEKKAPKAPPAPGKPAASDKTTPANAPTAEELESEYTAEIEQLAHIIALMTAECVFAYENPFEIKLESQFAMMFDMELSFSYNSLKEAERQLMAALSEIFSKKESSAFFFKALDTQMREYVGGLSASEKFEYKQKSGYGRPDKLGLSLEGEYAPSQVAEDCYKLCVEFWDNTRRANNPFRYEVLVFAGGTVTGTSSEIQLMKAKKDGGDKAWIK